MEELDADVREVLKCRSVRDKIAIPINCALAPVHLLPTVAKLVRDGIMVWLDRAALELPDAKSGRVYLVACDVYLLTPKGTTLCDQHGIAGHE